MSARLTALAVPDAAHEVMGRVVDILASGESDVVAFLECYFDESGSHYGSPVLCLAGYLFEKDQCKALDLGWKAVLDRYRLPFFHMTSCAHNQRPFDHLTRDECVEAEKGAIGLINEHAMLGVAAAVNESDLCGSRLCGQEEGPPRPNRRHLGLANGNAG
jgi:hypothetical protein